MALPEPSGRVKGVKKKLKAVQARVKRSTGRKTFSGRCVVVDGVKHLDRKFSDPEAWMKRRAKELEPVGGWPKPPAHWPPGVRVDIGRPVWWLPDGWGQGIKTTCVSRLRCFISPEGVAYYHKHIVEEVSGQRFEPGREPKVQIDWARARATIAIREGRTFDRKTPKFAADSKLFGNLDKTERRHLPESAKDLYFAVVSARRADDERGVRTLTNVQAQLVSSGAEPVWYVDAPSLASYRALGLKCKVGGKLVPARNLALRDAAKLGKPCVQISDDISHWTYYVGDLGKQSSLQEGNLAAKAADRLHVSPVAAARFLVAKLRACPEVSGRPPQAPKLAGVFPLGNTGQAFSKEAVSWDNFILGDFFVAEPSPVRFDTRMTLKEDYDYTCAHLKKHGSVLRCNRMFICALHEVNKGGACSYRDGERERAMIKLLQEKWPGVFHKNPRRGDTQVILTWRRLRAAQ